MTIEALDADLRVPPDLHERDLPLASVAAGISLYRIQLKRYPDPLHFGRTGSSRWDCPANALNPYGVLYTAFDAKGAFYETLGHDIARQIFSDVELRERIVHVIALRHPLHVVDLTGDGLAQLRVDVRLTSTVDLSLPQSWSHALHHHPSTPAGIRYVSRHQPALHCLALFERHADALDVVYEENLMYWQDSNGHTAVDYVEARGGLLVIER